MHVHVSGIEFPTPLIKREQIWYSSKQSVHQTSNFVYQKFAFLSVKEDQANILT